MADIYVARSEMETWAKDVETLRPFAENAIGSTPGDEYNDRIVKAWDLVRARFQTALAIYIIALEELG